MLPDCWQYVVVHVAYEEWHKSQSITTKQSAPNIPMAKATEVIAVKENPNKLPANLVLLMISSLVLWKSKNSPSRLSCCSLLVKV
jgi:hypothetical protein